MNDINLKKNKDGSPAVTKQDLQAFTCLTRKLCDLLSHSLFTDWESYSIMTQ